MSFEIANFVSALVKFEPLSDKLLNIVINMIQVHQLYLKIEKRSVFLHCLDLDYYLYL